MSAWFDHRRLGHVARARPGRRVVLVASVATVVGLSALVTGGFAQSPSIFAAAAKPDYVPVCAQRSGTHESRGDLNIRLKAFCAKGTKPLKLATWPVKGEQGPRGPQGPPGGGGSADEYGVANVFVSRGGNRPSRFATYSVTLGSPVGSTTGGHFRFSCTAAQSPCKISVGAAVLSSGSRRAVAYPRIEIHRQDGPSIETPMTQCEYADGAANRIARVPLRTAVGEIRHPLTVNVGGSFDCGNTGQPGKSGRVKQIWVASASNGSSTAYYDVWTTLNFGRKN
jgi:hypothetical protein